jgi:hypothetical protein
MKGIDEAFALAEGDWITDASGRRLQVIARWLGASRRPTVCIQAREPGGPIEQFKHQEVEREEQGEREGLPSMEVGT